MIALSNVCSLIMIFGFFVILVATLFMVVRQRYLEIGLIMIICGLAGIVGYFIDLSLENQTKLSIPSFVASIGLVILGCLKIKRVY